MNKQELKDSLATLQTELEQLDDTNTETKERINELISEIEQQLENPEDAERSDSLLEDIHKHIELFEVEHPRITGILNRIMMALSDMGI